MWYLVELHIELQGEKGRISYFRSLTTCLQVYHQERSMFWLVTLMPVLGPANSWEFSRIQWKEHTGVESPMMLERSCYPTFHYIMQQCITHFLEESYRPVDFAIYNVDEMKLNGLCVNMQESVGEMPGWSCEGRGREK